MDKEKFENKDLKIAEKALELLEDKNNYYKFVNENTETINIDLAKNEAKEIVKLGKEN